MINEVMQSSLVARSVLVRGEDALDYDITRAHVSLTVQYHVDLRAAPNIQRPMKKDAFTPEELVVEYRGGRRSEYGITINGHRVNGNGATGGARTSIRLFEVDATQRAVVDRWLKPILAELDEHMAAVLDNPRPYLHIKTDEEE